MIAIEREKKKKIFSRWSCQLWFNYAAVIISWRQKKIFLKTPFSLYEAKDYLKQLCLANIFYLKTEINFKKEYWEKNYQLLQFYANFQQNEVNN